MFLEHLIYKRDLKLKVALRKEKGFGEKKKKIITENKKN